MNECPSSGCGLHDSALSIYCCSLGSGEEYGLQLDSFHGGHENE